jgi:hypothetical protein
MDVSSMGYHQEVSADLAFTTHGCRIKQDGKWEWFYHMVLLFKTEGVIVKHY